MWIAVVGHGSLLGQLVVTVPGPLAEEGAGAVGGDPVQPGLEPGVAPEAIERPVGPQVGVLRDVPSVLVVPGEPIRQRVGLRVGGPHQLLERPLVARLGRGDQRREVSAVRHEAIRADRQNASSADDSRRTRRGRRRWAPSED